jgi:CBS domain-containing protein
MITVGQILTVKGQEVHAISPEATVYEALRLMAHKNIGAVLIIQAGKLVGIFSERDYARSVVLKGRASREMQVKEIMSRNVITIAPSESIEACMALMTDQRIRHLPVVQGGELVGLISIGDVVKKIISYQRDTIEDLQAYIFS